MNELTLHYVTQADRERAIEETLRDRQMLDAAALATQSSRATSTQDGHDARPTREANVPGPRSTPVRARAIGR